MRVDGRMPGGGRQRGGQEPGRGGDVQVRPEWLPVVGDMAVWSYQHRPLPAHLVRRREFGGGDRRDRQRDLSDCRVRPPAAAVPGEGQAGLGDERGRRVPYASGRSGEEGKAVAEEVEGGSAARAGEPQMRARAPGCAVGRYGPVSAGAGSAVPSGPWSQRCRDSCSPCRASADRYCPALDPPPRTSTCQALPLWRSVRPAAVRRRSCPGDARRPNRAALLPVSRRGCGHRPWRN